MAELYKGRVIRMTFGGGTAEDVRVLERLLCNVQVISGFAVDLDTCTVLAFADEPVEAEGELVRALIASGMYPVVSNDAVGVDGQGRMAC